MSLKYITREGVEKLSKHKVFCAYHPIDKGALNNVCKDILDACDCTVFYYETGNEPTDEQVLEEELSTMNLFVLIVSSELLFGPCFARDVAYEFAKKHAIPVLPIMIESKLEESFNQVFGNLQCITMYQERYDATSVPYTERLSNYLAQMLSTDIDIGKMRSSFDACLFLSYRKKDRQFAQQLMKIIHEDERSRNIAIWYDEFLVLGEDFNENIKSELEQSDAFVLVITPNTVEDNNYIALIEYPMAVALQKKILPFEMVSTSKEDLMLIFPGIPTVNGTSSGGEVRGTIIDALSKLGVKPVENTYEKEFLIGVSYLKGFFVEKNGSFGFEKIRSAAENGVLGAVRTMVQIYLNGEGVERSLPLATEWQNKLLCILLNEFNSSGDKEKAEEVLKAYFDLAEILELDNDIAASQRTLAETIEFCDLGPIKNERYAKHAMATAYEVSGRLWLEQGECYKAQNAFTSSLPIRESIYNGELSELHKLELVECHEMLAECFENIGNVTGIKVQLVSIKKYMSDEDAKDGDEDLIRRKIRCNNRLGHFYTLLNDWEKAFLCIGNNVLLAQKYNSICNNTESKRLLIQAHINDGDQHLRCNVENHLRVAKDAYFEAYEISLDLLRESESIKVKLDIAEVLSKIGHVMHKLKHADEAKAYFSEAVSRYRAIHGEANGLHIKKEFYSCCTLAAEMYIDFGDTDTAISLLTESLDLSREVVSLSPSPRYKIDHAHTLSLLADIYKKQWDTDKALEYHRKRCECLRTAFTASGRISDMKLYATALKEYISVAKLACEFDEVKSVSNELSALINNYSVFFN